MQARIHEVELEESPLTLPLFSSLWCPDLIHDG